MSQPESAHASMNTEGIYDAYNTLDAWSLDRSVNVMLDSHIAAAQAVKNAHDAITRAATALEERLAQNGRLILIGAGTSGRLAAQEAAELLPTFGFTRAHVLLAGGDDALIQAREGAEDDEAAAIKQINALELNPLDSVIGIAASGRTPYTIAGITQARQQQALTIGIANNSSAPLLTAAELGILLETAPEVLAGSTRLGAGTAQKIALNTLTTSVLVRLGGAYGNLMVGMQPTNQKLHERAARIVSSGANVSLEAARDALKRAQGDMRAAIVLLETGVTLDEAKQLLSEHKNRVRDVIALIKNH